MQVFEFVFAIIVVITIGRLLERHLAGRRRYQHDAGPTPEQQARAQRVDDLEKRVQVLERIVTDQGYELRQKFRDLED
jgi:methylphosphotriester-DNA--protein-cysteine methyltransferase